MSGAHVPSPLQRRARRGSAYILVLLTTLIVTLLGMSALTVERLQTRAATIEHHWAEAQVLAHSGMEHALLTIERTAAGNPGWRTALAGGAEHDLGGGTFTWWLEAHGSLASRVRVLATGARGEASHTLAVTLRPDGPPMGVLSSSLHAEDGIDFGAGSVVRCDSPITANVAVTATTASIFADVIAADEIAGSAFLGVKAPFEPVLATPDPVIIDEYVARATVVDVDALPGAGVTRYVQGAVLSPDVNPFGGETNPEGVYVIDCNGRSLVVRDARILGTLILLRPGNGTGVGGGVHWSPAIPGFPTLLVDGPLRLECATAAVSESALGVNFNPPGTPFNGDADTVLDDEYLAVLRGLIYATETITIAGTTRVQGTVICAEEIAVASGTVLEMIPEPALSEHPPPGFLTPDGRVLLEPFSWAQAVP